MKLRRMQQLAGINEAKEDKYSLKVVRWLGGVGIDSNLRPYEFHLLKNGKRIGSGKDEARGGTAFVHFNNGNEDSAFLSWVKSIAPSGFTSKDDLIDYGIATLADEAGL